jgi:membrane-associated protease RseP (regulator of RpoE activity)
VWGFDPGMYLPILHFARVNRIPLIGVNVDRRLISEIGAKGLASLPTAGREGVSTPAAAKAKYRETLAQVFNDHGPKANDPAALARFIEAQIFWDRAFAEGLAAAAQRPGAPLVVGIMGSGHLSGEGVPHQLADLGFADSPVLLPVDADTPCSELPSGMAQAVFALPPARAESAAPRPRLGVTLEPAVDGVRVAEVTAGSVAEQAGLKAGDLVRTIASRPVKESRDVTEAVARQAPGTWLPLTVARGGGQIDLVAKFPPAP